MNDQAKDLLANLGLSDKERAIYFAALELGESLQQPLSKKAKVKRTTLRELLPSLLDRGFLQQKVRGKRKYLVACDPKELVQKIQDMAHKAESYLPMLLAFQNTLKNKPEVRFFEGVDGIKQIYQMVLDVGQPMYSFIDGSLVHPEVKKWLLNNFYQEKLARKIMSYNINNPSPENKIIMPEDGYRQNRTVSKEEFPFKLEFISFGDYVAFIHFREDDEPCVVLVKSRVAAETFRSIYKLAWDYTSKK